MSVAVAMILFGALLVYGGWRNLSIAALLKGDNTQAKPASSGTPSSTSAPSNAPSSLAPLPTLPVTGGKL